MTTTSESEFDGTVAVQLIGGPADLPAELRAQRIPAAQHKIKIRFYGGYEHFERRAEEPSEGGPLPLYWTGRTRVAE